MHWPHGRGVHCKVLKCKIAFNTAFHRMSAACLVESGNLSGLYLHLFTIATRYANICEKRPGATWPAIPERERRDYYG